MATAHFVTKARKNIYENGKIRKYKSLKGKHKGEILETLDVTIPENKKDKILIKAGESYYWWQFKGGNKNYSKERPRRSSLTRSGYLSSLYDIEDRIGELRANVSSPEDLSSEVEDIKSELESLKDDTQNSLDAMPDHLQESSSSGQLLTERIEALDNAISELESFDCDDYEEPDEDECREELKDNVDPSVLDSPEEGDEGFDDYDEDEDRKNKVSDTMIEEYRDEKLSDWLDEKCDELSNVSFE